MIYHSFSPKLSFFFARYFLFCISATPTIYKPSIILFSYVFFKHYAKIFSTHQEKSSSQPFSPLHPPSPIVTIICAQPQPCPLPRLHNRVRQRAEPQCPGPTESTSVIPRSKIPPHCHFFMRKMRHNLEKVKWQFKVTQERSKENNIYLIFSTTLKDKMFSPFPIKGNWASQGLHMVYQRSHNQ